jgi:hypothetical protein
VFLSHVSVGYDARRLPDRVDRWIVVLQRHCALFSGCLCHCVVTWLMRFAVCNLRFLECVMLSVNVIDVSSLLEDQFDDM